MKGEKEERKEASPQWKASMEKKDMENKINFTIICNNTGTPLTATCSPKDSTHSNTKYITSEKVNQLTNTSPGDLMSILQQHSSFPQPWKLRTKDLAVQEIIQERREAIETGRLKGRRLFEPIRRGRTILNDGLSGDMGQESEVRSLAYGYSEDETYSSSSSSSLPCLSCDSVDKDQEVKEVEAEDVCNAVAMEPAETRDSDANGGRHIVFLGMIAIALLVFAIYKSWAPRFEHHEVILVPT